MMNHTKHRAGARCRPSDTDDDGEFYLWCYYLVLASNIISFGLMALKKQTHSTISVSITKQAVIISKFALLLYYQFD